MLKVTYPAQIVFMEAGHAAEPRSWTGRLLRQSACLDVGAYKGRARTVTWTPRFDITENPETGQCTVTMNGGPTPHSRRYAIYASVTAAQKAGIRWAARRFRVPSTLHAAGLSAHRLFTATGAS